MVEDRRKEEERKKRGKRKEEERKKKGRRKVGDRKRKGGKGDHLTWAI